MERPLRLGCGRRSRRGARAQLRLATVLVGDDPASHLYIGSKQKAARAARIEPVDHRLPAETTQDVLGLVAELNADDTIDGILVQSPLPPQIDEPA